MTYKEELKQQCEALSNQELLTVVNNKGRYNEMIVTAAQIELKKRQVTKEDRQEYAAQEKALNRTITGNITKDLHFIEKVGLYVLCLPILVGLVARDYRRRKLHLKARQSYYFAFSSMIWLVIMLATSIVYEYNATSFLIIWAVGFILAISLNHYYFKLRITQSLAERHADYKD